MDKTSSIKKGGPLGSSINPIMILPQPCPNISIGIKPTAANTKFEDTFDYSVYEDLEKKFSDNPPRGGFIFKSPLRLVNHHASCSKCHYSFEVDTYGRGCTANCVYCYALEQLTARGYWNRPHPFPADILELRNIFATVFETDKPSKWRHIIERRIPIRFGSMTDCFMPMERKFRVSHELLKILKHYRYPYIVFTRSDLIAKDDYLKVLDTELASIQFSICGGNEALTKILEPGAPTVRKRLKALTLLRENGFWTTVRINPLFPMYPDGYFTNSESVKGRFGGQDKVPKFPLFDFDFITQLVEAQVPSVLAGFVRLSPVAVSAISKSTGVDLRAFFLPELQRGSYDRKYSDSEIAFYYKQIQSRCAREGIRFNSCYIGNGIKDYFSYQELWSNRSDCCDARGNVPSFSETSQSIPWDERIRHSASRPDAERAKMEEAKHSIDFSSNRTSDVYVGQTPSWTSLIN